MFLQILWFSLTSCQASRFFSLVSCTPVGFCSMILPSDSDPKPSVEQPTPPFCTLQFLENLINMANTSSKLYSNMCWSFAIWFLVFMQTQAFPKLPLACVQAGQKWLAFIIFLQGRTHPWGICSSGWTKCLEWQDIKSSVYISYQLLPWLQSLSTWCLCFRTCITMLGFRFPPVN